MNKVEITINGKHFPCRPTMGAMLRFKKETGREITEIESGSFTDICTYLWCCIVSACKHDGIEFNLSLMDFADSISPDDMADWEEAIKGDAESQAPASEDSAEGEKKSH